MTRVGVVADTHGYFDPRLVAALAGAEIILHAGDVGSLAVLEHLREIAPVIAVRGNNDDKLGGLGLPLRENIEIAGTRVHLVHQLPHAQPPPECRIIVYGHTHRAVAEWRGGTLFVNPGAAGRVGFHAVQTVALLDVCREGPSARIAELGIRTPARRSRSPSSTPA